jgi:hypothetical protein
MRYRPLVVVTAVVSPCGKKVSSVSETERSTSASSLLQGKKKRLLQQVMLKHLRDTSFSFHFQFDTGESSF